ncbi:endospore germination permease [Bacillus sp. FJAT-27251]|uniref:GerAB/ArcD/ProY family transporter n=1 Tax=Bacillus sp. FJAT-27251 TaxID=1684142 RepID=UPI000AF75F9C|nr:endospore germination permease [Bacillus sp. FJAT-27251]
MPVKIAPYQLSFLVANFIFTGTLISLPQSLAELANQNSWMAPLPGFIFMAVFISLIIGGTEQLAKFSKKFLAGKRSIIEKAFLIAFGVLFAFTFIRDVRGLVDFVATVLLPTTPIDVLSILATLIIIYVAGSGLEVITRVTAIHFTLLAAIVIFLPFMLLNEINLANFQPVFTSTFMMGLSKSSFVLFSWIGEGVFILLLLGNVNNVKKARRAALKGFAVGMGLLSILLALMISVLGVDIVAASTYPAHQMVQQINLTDFLDRLDLIIVTVWIPTFMSKIALDLYMVNRCLTGGRDQDINVIIIPLGLTLGLLSILMFHNNMEHFHFSFYTWAGLGLGIQLLIGFLFLLRRKFS